MEMGIDTQKRCGRELSLGICKKVCIFFKKLIHHSSSRKQCLLNHVRRYDTHNKNSDLCLKNTIIPNSWVDQTKLSDATETCSLPYGVALNIQDTSTYQSSIVNKTNSMVTVSDRTNDKEAYVLSFVGENSVPLSRLIVPN